MTNKVTKKTNMFFVEYQTVDDKSYPVFHERLAQDLSEALDFVISCNREPSITPVCIEWGERMTTGAFNQAVKNKKIQSDIDHTRKRIKEAEAILSDLRKIEEREKAQDSEVHHGTPCGVGVVDLYVRPKGEDNE